MYLHECDFNKTLARSVWPKDLRILLDPRDNYFYVRDDSGNQYNLTSIDITAPDWEYYKKKFKKVKLYQYAVFSNGIWQNTNTYFHGEQAVYDCFDCKIAKKLDYTEIEVEEEE